jgi:hypothetical protein
MNQKARWIGIAASTLLLVGMTFVPTAESDTREQSKEAFLRTTSKIERTRRALYKRWRRARNRSEKHEIISEARQTVVNAIVNDIFPFWMGTPWTMAVIDDGLKPNAKTPFDKGKGISCSFFITSVLENAGLRFVNRDAFAGTIAIKAQRAFTPGKKYLKRFVGISPLQLKKKMQKLGSGLYLVGLNCHIGFIAVKGEDVRFIHSNYLGDVAVTDEPLETSPAIALSEDAGYVVTSLFKDNRLVFHWLASQKLPFKSKPARP